jgi:phage terminase large subunit GpA-like protein
LRERNEALDCRVYARAAAWIAGADRWTEAMWHNLEQQIGATDASDAVDVIERVDDNTNVAGVLRHRSSPRRRRIFRSSYLS